MNGNLPIGNVPVQTLVLAIGFLSCATSLLNQSFSCRHLHIQTRNTPRPTPTSTTIIDPSIFNSRPIVCMLYVACDMLCYRTLCDTLCVTRASGDGVAVQSEGRGVKAQWHAAAGMDEASRRPQRRQVP